MTDSWPTAQIVRRSRVLTDNDYGGDPDGLVELAQLLLSPSVEVSGVIGSRAREVEGWGATADQGVGAARAVIDLAGRSGDVALHLGASSSLVDHSTPVVSAGAEAIVAEAMRDDTQLPLYVTCGAGLTQIASAWLIEPRIGPRVTLVWIGGSEHPGHADFPQVRVHWSTTSRSTGSPPRSCSTTRTSGSGRCHATSIARS